MNDGADKKISFFREHIRDHHHNPDSNLPQITRDELDQISKAVQKLRLRPFKEKARAIFDILQQHHPQHIFQLQYPVIFETAEALKRGEPGSDEVFEDIESRMKKDRQLADYPLSKEEMRRFCGFIKPFILSLTQGGHFLCPPHPKNVGKANQEVQQMTTSAQHTEPLPQSKGKTPVVTSDAYTAFQLEDFQTNTSTKVASSGIPTATEESMMMSGVDTENMGGYSHDIDLMGDDSLGQHSGSQDNASSTSGQRRSPQLSFDPFFGFSVLGNEQVNPPYQANIDVDGVAANYEEP